MLDVEKKRSTLIKKEQLKLPDNAWMIHLFGPPGSGKTTLAIQFALATAPHKTFYFISSHEQAITKRMNQMATHPRWRHTNLFQSLFPVSIMDLDDLSTNLEKIRDFEAIKLIVIDFLTDFHRGALYKEEVKDKIRKILETLTIYSDLHDCKVLIVNSCSYEGTATASDLIESFCDLTLELTCEKNQKKLAIDQNIFEIIIDESGIASLEIEF